MGPSDEQQMLRAAAFSQVRRMMEVHDQLTASDLSAGFLVKGERLPLVNPQRGIFKPRQMQHLLSIRTVFPKPGARVWYDDQRHVHRQIYEGQETIDYAFMGGDPEVAENRWLREAMATGRHAQEVDDRYLLLPNGIPLSKIHHAAFDAHLIGIDPDFRVHVSDRLLSQQDGPLLEALKKLHHGPLHLPTRTQDRPDRDRLAARYEQFRSAA